MSGNTYVKRVDEIQIEPRQNWTLEECMREAKQTANRHGVAVRFSRDGKEYEAHPDFYQQLRMPEF